MAARPSGSQNPEGLRRFIWQSRTAHEAADEGQGLAAWYAAPPGERIRFIKEAQQIGFSLSEIGELLALRADPAADCSSVQQQAVAKRQEIHRKIQQLQQIDAALEALIAACPGSGALQACSIIELLTLRASKPASERKSRRSDRDNSEQRSIG